MKFAIIVSAVAFCASLCSCAKNIPAEKSATEISISITSAHKKPHIEIKQKAISESSRPDGKQEKITPLPDMLPKSATVADDKKKFL